MKIELVANGCGGFVDSPKVFALFSLVYDSLELPRNVTPKCLENGIYLARLQNEC